MRLLRDKIRAVLGQFPYLGRTMRLVWDASRPWTIAWLTLLVLQGLLPAATVYLTRWLVDSLVIAVRVGGSWPAVRPAVVAAALMAAILLLTELLRSVTGWVRTAQSELVQDHITALIHAKSSSVDFAFYESPDYYDHLHRARTEAGFRPVLLLESLGGLLQSTITLVAMAAVLIPYGLWLPVALLVSTLPAFYVVLRYRLSHHQWWLRTTADERRTEYYDWLLTTGEIAAELRLFGLNDRFHSAYQRLRERLRNERLELARKESWAELASGAVALLITAAAMAWMVWRALQGQVTLGGLALFYQAFSQGQNLMRSLLGNVGQIYANSLFLAHLFEFLALEPRVTDPDHPLPAPAALKQGICFRDVTFRYPGSERVALSDFSLTIPAGQIVAIVGSNGAGKSTLIKLLCRLYDPDAGQIEVDGIDLRRLRVVDVRRLITVLFQQPVHYSATVAENIAVGSPDATPSDVEAAARAAGADEIITGLPHGYENLLGKWFAGGAELSGGEWQRIALARAFCRQAPILLLDEPTSAMDSWAEEDWLHRFRRLASGRTVVVITHRFTTAMRADIIHVLEAGKITESGDHETLLQRGGRYARSWTAQMQAGASLRHRQEA